MERIKAAIQKARSQGARAPSAPRSHARVRESGVAKDIETIAYEQTKVVPLDFGRLKENRIVAFDNADPVTAAFDVLRTQVVARMRNKGWKSLAIVSPTPDCGKTVVGINLAFCLARQTNATVLLADFDLRKPKVSHYLGLELDHSLIDYVEDKAALADVFVNPGFPRLIILPNDRAVRNATEILTCSSVRSLVEEIKSRYESRFVLFDLPPLMPTDDAIAFLDQVDCVLLVIAEGHSTETEIRESLRLLKPFNIIGAVLNKAAGRGQSYYY